MHVKQVRRSLLSLVLGFVWNYNNTYPGSTQQ